MRQVPAANSRVSAHYLVIGDGRLARHLLHYLKLENLVCDQWSRKQPAQALEGLAISATHVLLAISDGAIESFLAKYPFLLECSCVHFSGAMCSDLLPSAHPLMTFAHELYDLETYRSIPFVLERGRSRFADLLPGLQNSSYEIEASVKPLYHAACAMSGNFTVLLWEKVFKTFASEFGLPKEVLHPYLARIAANLMQARLGESVLTGPLARSDFQMIEKHLDALGHDPYADVYRAFVTAYLKPSSSAPTPFPLGGLV